MNGKQAKLPTPAAVAAFNVVVLVVPIVVPTELKSYVVPSVRLLMSTAAVFCMGA